VLWAEGVVAPKTPMVGSFPGCCARAATGHATVPPSRVMNSRRLTWPPPISDDGTDYQMISRWAPADCCAAIGAHP
jgi:hypothetical protein